ncbi:MAG TPA: DUF5665 domain-containing protein [Candidatus Saccharimonadales bacterium]|nr:DUF5665 domain-containing protein [Candidatus Saccharimonadales bacterium]
MVKMNDKELLELGKKLQSFYDAGYVNKKQAVLFSFYKGLASGLGAFLGGTIVIGLVVWTLSLFSQIPLIGHFMHILDQTLKNR